MTYCEALKIGRQKLAKSRKLRAQLGLDINLETSVLLAHSSSCMRSELYARLAEPLELKLFKKYMHLIKKRSLGTPIAYILGTKEFYALEFSVGKGVLIPRPETELLVEQALSLAPNGEFKVLDLCTGSGCISISLQDQRPDWLISATDISAKALSYSKINNAKHFSDKGGVSFYKSNLFTYFRKHNLAFPAQRQSFDLIIANPPYLRSAECRERRQKFWQEPFLALEAGSDGMNFFNRIIDQAPDFLNAGGYLLLEAGKSTMSNLIKKLGQSKFRDLELIKDLSGLDRVVKVQK